MHRDSKLHFPQSSTLFLSSTSQTSSQNQCLYTVPVTPLPLHLLPSGFCPINSTKQDPAKVTMAYVSGSLGQFSPHPPCRHHCVFETHSFPSVVSPLFILVSFSLHCPLPQCLLQTLLCLALSTEGMKD